MSSGGTKSDRPPDDDSKRASQPALLFFFSFIDFIASGSKVINIIKERTRCRRVSTIKRNFGDGEDAISPVIGAILMVAITVILAAVFGPSLFAMKSDLKKQDIVLATASRPSPDTIDVTYYGGPDHNSIESINVTVNGLQVDDDSDSGNTSAIAGVEPGYTLTISNTSNMTANNGRANLNGGTLTITGGRDHVIVAARSAGGSECIILDTYV
jgi:flagellin-like protein